MGLDKNNFERRFLEGTLAPSVTRKSSEVLIDGKTIVKDDEGRLKVAISTEVSDAGTDEEIPSVKAVNDAIKEKCLITDDEILDCLIAADMLSAVTDKAGAIFTDENGKILLM